MQKRGITETHRLLDNLASNLPLQHPSIPHTIRGILSQDFLYHVRNMGVDIRRPISNTKVDLLRTLSITTKSSIVLETVTGTILMNRERRLECVRIRRFESSLELHACCETLPRVVGLPPPAAALKRVRSAIEDIV